MIQFKDVSFTFGEDIILEKVNLNLEENNFTVVLGPNGAGKSTFIKMLLGLVKPTSGVVEVLGSSPTSKKYSSIGFVSQKSNSFNHSFPVSVLEVVLTGNAGVIGLGKRITKEYTLKAKDALKQVGLHDYTNRTITELSGGQQQRVFIARALMNDPSLLVLDEPTVGIDAEQKVLFYDLLHRLHKEGKTILLVTHDREAVIKFATHVLFINKRIMFYGSTRKFSHLDNVNLSGLYDSKVVPAYK
ncbi:metal ABC transporter ATP-binding protein [Bacillus sp. DJP31]|uniref:metal ABC transporter ATP-binding protein n=1 Tax=Bacillus sp. DJP31 TaxID=3409789 RepID=UPI003BB5CF81